ncbi:MAG: tetratricopeptide repeat protein [Flavobacteriales bacterium]|nr:tetratricopeptide repeat protein [Flavobacteriales bacterium]
MRPCLFLSVLLLSIVSAHAQNDGLTASQVLDLPDDTGKVLRLSDQCFAYRRVDQDSALLFGHKAVALAQQLRYKKGEAQACNDLAIIHMDRSEYGAADSLLRSALLIRNVLKDSAGIGAIHNKLGNVFQSQFRLEEALEENFKALRIFERIGPPAKQALILNNIAILQFNLRRYTDALATHTAAAVIRERIGDGQGLAESKGNMANVQVVLGDTASALRLFQEASTYFREHGLARELAIQLHNEAGVLMARNEVRQAMPMYHEALSIREQAGEKKAIASSLTGLGSAYLRLGNTTEARRLFHRALHLGREVGARSEMMQALQDLAMVHAKLNDGDSTYWYYERYSTIRDSVFNADLNGRLADMETRYGTERKEREIQRQRADITAKSLELAELDRRAERRRFWLAIALGGIGVVLLAALLVLQVQRRRAREARDSALLTERERGMKALMEATEAERGRIARELHDGIGQQLTGLKFRIEDIASRLSAAASDESARMKEVLSIADDAGHDVREIAHSMMPRALGTLGLAPAIHDMLQKAFGAGPVKCTLEHHGMETRVDPSVEVGIYRIAQELVGNILKHAKAREVSVQLLRNKGHVVMIVEDDGVGFDTQDVSDHASGMGLSGMQDRARVLHGTLQIESAPGRGTITTLRMPVKGTPLPT